MLIEANLYSNSDYFVKIFLSIDSLSNNHNNQMGWELFMEASVHVILNIIKARFFFVFMVSSDDLNGAARFGSIF